MRYAWGERHAWIYARFWIQLKQQYTVDRDSLRIDHDPTRANSKLNSTGCLKLHVLGIAVSIRLTAGFWGVPASLMKYHTYSLQRISCCCGHFFTPF